MLLTPLYRLSDWLRHRARMRVWHSDHAWGRRAEDLAHRYLESKGYRIVERNWTHPNWRAEVDLIAWDGERLVFVEVKSRRNRDYSAPERSLDRLKREQVRKAAFYFMRRLRVGEEAIRFDLVTVVFEPLEIRHLPDIWLPFVRPERTARNRLCWVLRAPWAGV